MVLIIFNNNESKHTGMDLGECKVAAADFVNACLTPNMCQAWTAQSLKGVMSKLILNYY